MGVAGSGKTTVGTSLSKIFSVPFYDADDYHNHKNIEKMRKGLSLNDSDRKPWLNLLALKIKEWNSKGDAVLACSALKKDYRLILSQDNEVTFIFLEWFLSSTLIRPLLFKGFIISYYFTTME